jgi:hypothetical protein
MLSRRQFLEAGAVAAGITAVAHPLPASAVARDDTPNTSPLPPSLARLKSRKSEATPISREERATRQDRARKLMTENAIDAICDDVRHFSQLFHWNPLVGWGAHVRFRAAGERRGVLRMSGI